MQKPRTFGTSEWTQRFHHATAGRERSKGQRRWNSHNTCTKAITLCNSCAARWASVSQQSLDLRCGPRIGFAKLVSAAKKYGGRLGANQLTSDQRAAVYERRCQLFAIARRSSALNRSEKHRKVSFTAATMIVRDRVQRWGLQGHRLAAKGNEKRTRCRARKRRFIMASSLAAP
jgi:hypothetical protein